MYYSSLLYPYLHSFPTRRSSDLAVDFHTSILKDKICIVIDFQSIICITDCGKPFQNTPALSTHQKQIGIDHRSEEHTSELQSRFDLVCRLLLEKKKTYKN